MIDPGTKALFRCLFPYLNGVPVAVFDLGENCESGDRALEATVCASVSLKVAVVRDTSALGSDAAEWPELLAAAYEMFVNDGKVASDRIEWVTLRAAT